MQEILVYNGTAYFCFAHVQPTFKLPKFVNLVKTAPFYFEYDGPSFELYDHVEGLSWARPSRKYISDYGLFFAAGLLRKLSVPPSHVVLSAHRKFVSRRPAGQVTNIFPNHAAFMVKKDDIDVESHILDTNSDFLLIKPMRIPFGLALNFSRSHRASDWIRILNILLEDGMLLGDDVQLMTHEDLFIPAVPLGKVPLNVFLSLADMYERVVRVTDIRNFKCELPDDPYQSRARSFFLERLASYFLFKLTRKSLFFSTDNSGVFGYRNELFGYLINVFDPAFPESKNIVGLR